ncbi:MAG TPA: hypothetical protein VK447_10195 [Myxococcaceae bacterium]|nr:hypothetical protein [Myxococcaceae bacterium]
MKNLIRSTALFPLLTVALVGCGGPASEYELALGGDAQAVKAESDELDEKGAFTSDFIVPGSFSAGDLVPVLERDRMYMAARPGFVREYTGIRIAENGDSLPSGRYFFENVKRAEEYKTWLESGYVLDGEGFINRSYIQQYELHAWSVIGSADLGDFRTSQMVTRTERFSVPSGNVRPLLKARWPALLAEARQRGMTGVWLLYSQKERLVSVVYFADRVGQPDAFVPDFTSLKALETAPALGDVFADQGWTRTFDRTSWVFGVWFPFVLGDRGEPALWPYSPPFPMPYAGDGVCEVSRGEDSVNAPGDCVATCGNGVADSGESYLNCPGDVRLFDEQPGTAAR